jgi:hypothetical protein
VIVAAYLYATLTAWYRFLGYQSRYSDELQQILGYGNIALLGSGGIIFGMIATRIGHVDGKLQILICCSAVFYWLFPYSLSGGHFLPRRLSRSGFTRFQRGVCWAQHRVA